jgi:hypothetical protein
MGKSMYNFGKNTKEKARQLKQMEKAAKRLAAKQNKANIELTSSGQGSDTMESSQLKEVI